MVYNLAFSQSHGGVEQYYYAGHKRLSTMVPRAYYQDEKNWYGEIRYNYDELETLSFNIGKTFSGEGAVSYAITPLVGVMAGKLKGGSLGVNVESGYENVFFSGESEYAFSASRISNFFFNWSELGYQVTPNIYTGVALQVTRLYRVNTTWEPGVMAGISLNKFTFPLFIFNPASTNRYFVLGINIEWGGSGGANNQLKCFSFY